MLTKDDHTLKDNWNITHATWHNESKDSPIHNRTYADEFESELEVALLEFESNITEVHVRQSYSQIYVTYVTTTPVDAEAKRARELFGFVERYGDATLSHNFGFTPANETLMFIEEVHRYENGTYDTRLSAYVNMDDARAFATGNMSIRELGEELGGGNVELEKNRLGH